MRQRILQLPSRVGGGASTLRHDIGGSLARRRHTRRRSLASSLGIMIIMLILMNMMVKSVMVIKIMPIIMMIMVIMMVEGWRGGGMYDRTMGSKGSWEGWG